jgi:tetratricopeptide (TPR) repeat protein
LSPSRRLRLPIVCSALFLAGCVGSDPAHAQGPGNVEELLGQGRYDDAIEILQDALGSAPAPDRVAQLAETLIDVGRYEEAEDVVREGLDANPGNAPLGLLRGRLLQETGRGDEALPVFEEVERSGSGSDALLARLHRGEVLLERGEQDEAFQIFDAFIDVYNSSSSLDSRGLTAVAGAVRHLEATNPALLQDALRAYDEALSLDPTNLEAARAIGMLFIRTYQIADARQAFQDVLARRPKDPQALLGMAMASHIEGSLQAGDLADQALEVNPRLVPALVLRAQIRLAGEDLEDAEDDLNAALEVDPTSSEALAVLAGARWLQDRTAEYEELTQRALDLNPRDAPFFVTISDLVSTRRFYREAVDFAARGVAVDSLAWSAFGAKGLNELRVGAMEEGRRDLETAFAGDPYNLWYKNTLDLLDVMDGFEVARSDRITLLVSPEDGEALTTYMLDWANRAYDSLSARYGYRPEPPIRVEAFRNSADFSVRTVGLAGLGALGVSFGTVVALDSPSARGVGGYNWASTLWHEMAHVMHLGMTDHRVPRWLSEGLAVHEEHMAGTGWGFRPSLPFLAAYLQDRLRPPSELSQSFVRPRFPDEVGFAYILGSLVGDWIEDRWGLGAIRGMLGGYGEGLSPEQVVERELDLDLDGRGRARAGRRRPRNALGPGVARGAGRRLAERRRKPYGAGPISDRRRQAGGGAPLARRGARHLPGKPGSAWSQPASRDHRSGRRRRRVRDRGPRGVLEEYRGGLSVLRRSRRSAGGAGRHRWSSRGPR